MRVIPVASSYNQKSKMQNNNKLNFCMKTPKTHTVKDLLIKNGQEYFKLFNKQDCGVLHGPMGKGIWGNIYTNRQNKFTMELHGNEFHSPTYSIVFDDVKNNPQRVSFHCNDTEISPSELDSLNGKIDEYKFEDINETPQTKPNMFERFTSILMGKQKKLSITSYNI